MSTPRPPTVLQRHFITIRGRFGTRQVHYRRGGDGPVVLLLHQSPQSSREMEPLIEAWSRTFTLIAPDSPGYGYSQPLQQAGQPVTTASIDDYAVATLELADALGLGRMGIYGFHTGASIGVALADACPDRVTAVAANGLVVLTEDERMAILRDYLPPLVPRWDGGHLAWLWGRVREQIIFFPWHDRRAAARMYFPMPDASRLQQGVDEFLAAGDHYHVAYAAAFSDRAELRLPSLQVPLLVTAAARDPLAGHLARIGPRSGTVRILPSPDANAALDQALAHLVNYPGDTPAVQRDGERVDTRAATFAASTYLGPPGRQVRCMHRAAQNPGAGHTVILLHAAGSSAESIASLAGNVAEHAAVLALDLPGHGASDPVGATESGGALAGTVKQLSAALAPLLATPDTRPRTTVIAMGTSAPVAIELARGLGGEIRVVLLHPPAWSASDADEWVRRGLPPITPVWAGGHLLEAWHLVRDSRLFTPWFRTEPAGIRSGEPDLDDAGIHRDVRDLLRANGAWQALLRDALGYGDRGERPSGLQIIRLEKAPENWASILTPDHAGIVPSS